MSFSDDAPSLAPERADGPQTLLVFAWSFVAFVLASTLSVVVLVVLTLAQGAAVESLETALAEAQPTSGTLVSSVLTTSLVLAGLGVAAATTVSPPPRLRQSLRLMRFSPCSASDLVLSAFGTIGASVLLDALIDLSGLRDFGALAAMRETISTLEGPTLWAVAVTLGLGPGLGEEIFFRGYMLRRLEVLKGPGVALAISSLLFGLFHLDPVHSPTAAGLGLYLGLVALWSGSIWPPIVGHSANNAVASLLAAEQVPQHDPLLGAGIGTAVALGALWWIRRSRSRRTTS